MFSKDTYFHICERFITKDQWNNHFILIDTYIKNEWSLASIFSTKKTG